GGARPVCWPTMCKHDPSFTEADCVYSPSHWTVDGAEPAQAMNRFVAGLTASVARVKAMTPSTLQVHKFGDDEREAFDIYGPLKTDSLFIWIHGGYWQEGVREHVAPVVEQMLAGGITVVSVGYRLSSPNRPVSALIYDVAATIEKVLALFPDTGRIVVGGHSAGGHLAYKVCALLKSSRITGIALVAGIFDLTELQPTVIGTPIGMTAEDALESSCRADEYSEGEIEALFLVGDCDTPRFRSQAIELHDGLKARKIKSQWVELPNVDHFTIIEGLSIESTKQTKLLKKFCSIQSL
ncbi:hypothetical protein PFISCL1PPCAC_8804, partial [Pristionchus fissidentatus]